MSAEAKLGTEQMAEMLPTKLPPTSNWCRKGSSSSTRPETALGNQPEPKPLTVDRAFPDAYMTIELLGDKAILPRLPSAATSNSGAKASSSSSPPETPPASQPVQKPLTMDTSFASPYLTTKVLGDMAFLSRPPAIPKALSDTLSLHSALSRMTYDIKHPINSRRKKALARMESEQMAGGVGAGHRWVPGLAAWERSPLPERRCAACSKPVSCGAHQRMWLLRTSGASSSPASSLPPSLPPSSQLPPALKRQRRADGICLHALLARDEK